MGIKLLTFYRILLSLIGIFLAFGFQRVFADDDRIRRWVYTFVLVGCTGFALYLHLALGPQFRNVTPEQIMNPHDFFHYYVGSKYHSELGYFDLYECSLVADQETAKMADWRWHIRDLHTYRFVRAQGVLARSTDRCKQNFTPERWISFKADVSYISRLMTPNRWNLVLKDKGYNATPVWNRGISVLTNLIPLRNQAGLHTLLGLDHLFTLIAFVAIGIVFGWRHSLLALAFWSLNFVSTPGFVRGSVSRLDWLACLMVAVCLLRRGRYASAGALAGLAATLRVFPVLFFVGLGCKGVWSLLRTRRIPRRYLRFLVGFTVVVVLLCGLTALTPHDRERWKDFGVKITGHDKQIAGYRVGFKYLLINPKIGGVDASLAQFESRQGVRWTVIALVLATVFLAARRLPDHHTLALSFVCIFFLTAPTFYYYQMLVIPFMLFLPDPRRRGLWVGMGSFFAWCVLCYTLRQMWPLGSQLSYFLSWSIAGLCALMLILIFANFRGDDTREIEPTAA